MFALKRIPILASRRFFSDTPSMILTQQIERVLLVTLNKPKANNALCTKLVEELVSTLQKAESNPEIATFVITGSEKAFAAGADIKEMLPMTTVSLIKTRFLQRLEDISLVQKPIIAAVNGWALGGGCELAMICDIVVAGEKAVFGLPEIKLGTFPGAGGTQRLTRAVGKSKAMQMILTGEPITAQEAFDYKLVSKVFPVENVVSEALKIAKTISGYSQPIVALAKDTINRSLETGLREGLNYEKKTFYSTFAFEDRLEGMKAFIEKRPPKFNDR